MPELNANRIVWGLALLGLVGAGLLYYFSPSEVSSRERASAVRAAASERPEIDVASASAPSAPPGVVVQALQVKRGSTRSSARVSGLLSPLRSVTLSAEEAGAIEEVLFEEHARVEAGDLLVRLDATARRAAVARAESGLIGARAALRLAKLELERARVKAPADGFIMNWQAVEGTMTTTVITSAQGTFQDTSRTWVVAVYRQNLVKNVKQGDVVEMAFASIPHHIATGKVDAVLEYTGEGQFLAAGVVPVAASVGSKGFLAVRIVLDDEDFARQLALGAAGTTAIYTGFAKPFQAISKVVMRIKAWMYYLPA